MDPARLEASWHELGCVLPAENTGEFDNSVTIDYSVMCFVAITGSEASSNKLEKNPLTA